MTILCYITLTCNFVYDLESATFTCYRGRVT